MTGVRVCGWGELDDGAARRVIVDGRPVALVRLGDRVHAIDDTCSHAEVSLAEGEVDAEECALECWKHGSLFDLETGEALTLPALKPVAVHSAVVDGDDVLVELAPELGQCASGCCGSRGCRPGWVRPRSSTGLTWRSARVRSTP